MPVEDLGRHGRRIAGSCLVFDHVDRVRGSAARRPEVRKLLAAWGGRIAGAPPAAAARSDDKIAARRKLLGARIPVPRGMDGWPGRQLPEACTGLRAPLVVKLPLEHGSRGILLVRNPAGLPEAIRSLAGGRGRQRVLIEEHVDGRELAAAVVEVRGIPRCLPLVEVDLGRSPVYSQTTKWGRGDLPIHAAVLSGAAEERVRAAAVGAFRALGLRDYARFDLRIDGRGTPRILEANVRPSLEEGTEMPLAARLVGLGLADLLALIILSAARRHNVLRQLPEKARAAARAAERSILKRGCP